jgi:hypothetical protein
LISNYIFLPIQGNMLFSVLNAFPYTHKNLSNV